MALWQISSIAIVIIFVRKQLITVKLRKCTWFVRGVINLKKTTYRFMFRFNTPIIINRSNNDRSIQTFKK